MRGSDQGRGVFQLTPSQRATIYEVIKKWACEISTHALTEGDSFSPRIFHTFRYFNSRPHRGRLENKFVVLFKTVFQLTPSQRATILQCTVMGVQSFQLTPSQRATATNNRKAVLIDISTHALTEGDFHTACFDSKIGYFNSRPHRGRLLQT